jgi:hypothetical protein
MSHYDDFRDLNDWKLETSFEDNPPCFVHTSYGADRASGIHTRAIVERWIPCPEPLGRGASGIVWLHNESSSNKKMRAVKQVSKFEMQRDNIDYKRELLALTKFSGKKVRNAGQIAGIYPILSNNFIVFKVRSLRRIHCMVRGQILGVFCHGIFPTRNITGIHKWKHGRRRCSDHFLSTHCWIKNHARRRICASGLETSSMYYF